MTLTTLTMTLTTVLNIPFFFFFSFVTDQRIMSKNAKSAVTAC